MLLVHLKTEDTGGVVTQDPWGTKTIFQSSQMEYFFRVSSEIGSVNNKQSDCN